MGGFVRHLFVWFVLALLSQLTLTAAFAQEASPRRLALIIGNSKYDNVYELPNASPDALRIADVLKLADFDVTYLRNADLEQMNDAINQIAAKAGKQTETVLFYYGGHGFQLGGVNYLVPRDAQLDRRDLIDERTLRLDSVLERLASASRQTLVFLDACRDNPLPQSVRGGETGNGLADVGNSPNTYVVFATAPGQVTYDGGGESSPFTKAFVKHVLTPDQSLSDTIMAVRGDVAKATLERQIVWESGALRQRFSFVDGMAVPDIIFDPAPPVVEPPTEDAPPSSPPGGEGPIKLASVPNDDIVQFGRQRAIPGGADVTDGGFVDLPITPDPGGLVDDPPVPVDPGEPVDPGFDIPATPDPASPPLGISPDPSDTPTEPETPAEPEGATPVDSVAGPEMVQPGEGWPQGTQVDPDFARPGGGAVPVSEDPPRTPTEPEELAVPEEPATPGPDEDLPVNAGPKLPPIDEGKQLVAEIPDDLIPTPPVEPVPAQPSNEELALLVQTELKRVGCYTKALDGDWGDGSRKALSSYAKAKKLAIGDFATLEVLDTLKAEPGEVCKQVVVANNPPVKKESKPAVVNQGGEKKKSEPKADPKPAPVEKAPVTDFKPVFQGSFR